MFVLAAPFLKTTLKSIQTKCVDNLSSKQDQDFFINFLMFACFWFWKWAINFWPSLFCSKFPYLKRIIQWFLKTIFWSERYFCVWNGSIIINRGGAGSVTGRSNCPQWGTFWPCRGDNSPDMPDKHKHQIFGNTQVQMKQVILPFLNDTLPK